MDWGHLFFKFSGRINRAKFWIAALIYFVINVVLTIIEDNCFIGARSEVVEGCIVREGSVLGMGVYIGKSTKIVDRESGEVLYGEVPANSVVVAGTLPGPPRDDGRPVPSLYCAVIVKRVDQRTRAKTSINELLRD